MKISTQLKDRFAIIKFEVDKIHGYEAQEFQESLLYALKKDLKFILIDLSNVSFISSWGIGMLIHGLTTTKNRNSEFRILCNTQAILQVFNKVKIDTVLDIYNSMEEAIS